MKSITLLASIAVAAGVLLLARDSRSAPGKQPSGRADVSGAASSDTAQRLKKATFAGGCFWCVEEAFDAVPGVVATISGYTGGHVQNPGYEEVSSGATGHLEAVDVAYDPARVGYADLLRVFWRNIDPTTPNRQFCDVGEQYRSAIFYRNEEQRKLAEASKSEIERTKSFKGSVVTEILPASEFYPAEDYHQDYYEKNPVRYKFYKYNCGRAQRLAELWGERG